MKKLKIYKFVRVNKKLPNFMSHFDAGFIGIISERKEVTHPIYGSYYHYGIFKLEGMKIIDEVYWYKEEHFKLCFFQCRVLAFLLKLINKQ